MPLRIFLGLIEGQINLFGIIVLRCTGVSRWSLMLIGASLSRGFVVGTPDRLVQIPTGNFLPERVA